MPRPYATVSGDVDPVDLHLHCYGVRGLAPDPLVYTHALPRLLELFARHGVRATLFVVARDADAQRDVLRAAIAAGHEVASHSLTHPIGLARLRGATLERELAESKRALEAATGATVAGFRAPQFDMDGRSLAALADAGYAYDASGCPSQIVIDTRIAMLLLGPDRLAPLRLRWLPFTWRRRPYVHRTGGRAIHEFPLSVTPLERKPLHHSLRRRLSDGKFRRVLGGYVWRREPISYLLHAADALGLAEDGVDRRLARWSGMRRPLAEKLDLLDRTMREIARRFEPVPFRDRLPA